MSTYLITGATGLVGAALVKHLAQEPANSVVAFVRNRDKAQNLFRDCPSVVVAEGSLESGIEYESGVDYIIHSAAPTGSDFFVNNPVETLDSIVLGTRSVLEFAKSKQVKSVVNLSSMEVYGASTSDEPITEDKQFYIDPLSLRSCYPIAKRLAENMCVAYSSEYAVPVKTVRLAQVLGKKLLPDDNRVIAQFIRAAQNHSNIELATDGSSRQTYVGIDDAVSGILTVLDKGVDGASYNLANDETYCSIYDVAKLVAEDIADSGIDVITNTDPDTSKYPPSRYLRLDSSKLQALGWSASTGLRQALQTLVSTK